MFNRGASPWGRTPQQSGADPAMAILGLLALQLLGGGGAQQNLLPLRRQASAMPQFGIPQLGGLNRQAGWGMSPAQRQVWGGGYRQASVGLPSRGFAPAYGGGNALADILGGIARQQQGGWGYPPARQGGGWDFGGPSGTSRGGRGGGWTPPRAQDFGLSPTGYARFDAAIGPLLQREGGYVNDPNDRGGATRYGITAATAARYGLNPRNITPQQAAAIYYNDFWVGSGASQIQDPRLAELHFDAAVNHGPGNARRFLEQSGGDPARYNQLREQFYQNIIARNPSQQRFARGWANRMQEMWRIAQGGGGGYQTAALNQQQPTGARGGDAPWRATPTAATTTLRHDESAFSGVNPADYTTTLADGEIPDASLTDATGDYEDIGFADAAPADVIADAAPMETGGDYGGGDETLAV